MKDNKRTKISRFFCFIKRILTGKPMLTISVICVISSVLIAIFNYHFGSTNDFHTDSIKVLLSALFTAAFVTPITQIISNDILRVRRNDKKLLNYGIQSIGTGKSTYNDEIEMFGSPLTGKYPKELDLLFLSGNGFMKNYENNIIQAIKHGCHVRILLVRPLYSGKINEFIIRYGKLCEPDQTSLAHQICCQTLPIIERIKNATANFSGKIEVKTYIDEFQANQRFAMYENEEKGQLTRTIKAFVNAQTSVVIAKDLSLLLRGTIPNYESADEKLHETNIMANYYKGFEELWKKYQGSPELSPDDWIPFTKVWPPDHLEYQKINTIQTT